MPQFHEVMGKFRVWVHTDGLAQQQELAVTEVIKDRGNDRLGGYLEYRYPFRNSEAGIEVQIRLRCYDDFVFGFVSGEVTNANAFGNQSSFAADNGIVIQTGKIEDIQALMANYQHKDWWTRPHFSPQLSQLPPRTLSLLWRSESDYVQVLPVCGPQIRTDLCGGTENSLQIRLSSYQSGHTRYETLAFVAGNGPDPYRLIENHTRMAMHLLEGQTLPREQKRYPEILDTLGWCSWDAFYHKVNEEGLLAKAEEIKQLELPVRWVMIDDGWSNVAKGKLSAFEADSEKFPHGLANTVDALKTRFGISWVGVWHTIAGYWGGIDPTSELACRYGAYLQTNVRGNLLPSLETGFGFWHGWHGFLKRQGIDFVKVDSQSAVMNFWRGSHCAGEAASAAHDALEASVALHFSDTIINCMGMASENIWHRPKSAVSRNSDDFVPQERHGFAEHALQNGYNSYFHGAFYWGDWDMFWTKNHDDVQNAVLRSVSGGPIYFSDAPGNTDPSKLWPLIYGDGRIIRCDRTPYPTEDCLLVDPTIDRTLLKLWNTVGDSGIVAAFHIGKYDGVVEGTVGPRDIPGWRGEFVAEDITDRKFVVYEHFSKKLCYLSMGERLDFRLDEEGCALYTMIPVRAGITPIGLADKYISSHAIVSCRTQGSSTIIALHEGGSFLFAAASQPAKVIVQGKSAVCSQVGEQLYEVNLRDHKGQVELEIVMP